MYDAYLSTFYRKSFAGIWIYKNLTSITRELYPLITKRSMIYYKTHLPRNLSFDTKPKCIKSRISHRASIHLIFPPSHNKARIRLTLSTHINDKAQRTHDLVIPAKKRVPLSWWLSPHYANSHNFLLFSILLFSFFG